MSKKLHCSLHKGSTEAHGKKHMYKYKQFLGLGLGALLSEDFRKEDGGADHHIGIVFRLTCTSHQIKTILSYIVPVFRIRPTPDPDPHVFGPPGSGSFYHKAKIIRKTLIPTLF
jgi:hypothetical protein